MKLTHRYWKANASEVSWAHIVYFSLKDKLVICRYWLLTRFAEMVRGARESRQSQAASCMDKRVASSAVWLGMAPAPTVARSKRNTR